MNKSSRLSILFRTRKNLSPAFPLLLLTILLCAGIAVSPLMAARGLTNVRNFSREDYGGGTQNWDAMQDAMGRMFFANANGMLIFDGQHWRLLRLPNYTAVRSLAPDPLRSDRIYAGGSAEFGFFQPDSITGILSYQSLIPTISKGDRNFSEIWHIHTLDNKVWFQGDFALYRYDGKSTIALPVGERIATSALIDNTIYLATQGGRILRIAGTSMQELPQASALAGKKIVAILPSPFQSLNPGQLLVATALDGLFLVDATHSFPLATPIDSYLRENQIFCAEKGVSDYIFGTVNNGAVIYDFESRTFDTINRHNGMQNNTVLAARFDRAGNIWLMLDNGIDYALHHSPIRNLLSKNEDCGAGYTSILYKGILYLGTNQALYSRPHLADSSTLPASSPALKREVSGQIWALDTIGGSLFVSGDAGLFYSSGADFHKIENLPGTFKVRPLPGRPEMAIASTYDKFHLLRRHGNEWVDAGNIKGYDDRGGDFFTSPDGAVWISHWMKGIFRLTLTADATQFSKIELFDSHAGLPADNNNAAILIDGNVYISTERNFFKYDTRSGKISPAADLNKLFGRNTRGRLRYLPDNHLLKLNSSELTMADFKNGVAGSIDSISLRPIAEKLIPGFEHINYISEREVVFATQDGFKTVDFSRLRESSEAPELFISTILAGDSTVYEASPAGNRRDLSLPFDLNSVRIEYASPEFSGGKDVVFSSRLDDYDDEWSAWSSESARDYTHLSEGKYTFHVRARHRASGDIAELAFPFRVRPPWYRSVWAYLLYAAILITILWLSFRKLRQWKRNAVEQTRLRKERELSEVIRASEQEALRKDHEISLLKSKKLEQDMRHKSQELGNITMNLIRKNEILNNISTQIAKIAGDPDLRSSHPQLKGSLDKIISSIRENISHDDDWKKFTENFDIVYQDYTKRLRELHPSLTAADLRICCYIKMGLSSKEIAPLINISYRSVEMTRYRLRKKMELSREQSLTDYLQSL